MGESLLNGKEAHHRSWACEEANRLRGSLKALVFSGGTQKKVRDDHQISHLDGRRRRRRRRGRSGVALLLPSPARRRGGHRSLPARPLGLPTRPPLPAQSPRGLRRRPLLVPRRPRTPPPLLLLVLLLLRRFLPPPRPPPRLPLRPPPRRPPQAPRSPPPPRLQQGHVPRLRPRSLVLPQRPLLPRLLHRLLPPPLLRPPPPLDPGRRRRGRGRGGAGGVARVPVVGWHVGVAGPPREALRPRRPRRSVPRRRRGSHHLPFHEYGSVNSNREGEKEREKDPHRIFSSPLLFVSV